MPEISVPVGYVEKPHQTLLHDGFDSHDNACVLAHRRAGKTVGAVAQVIREGMRCALHNPHVAYIAPTSVMARRVAWPYFVDMLDGVPGVRLRRQELTIEVPLGERGTLTIWLVGGENPDRLRGVYLDACVVDEMADMPGSLISTVLRPALTDRKGKLLCIGTVKGRNEFWRLYERAQDSEAWFTANLKPDDTGMLDEQQLASLREEMSEDEFRAEILNDPDAAVKGAYYGKAFQKLEEAGQVGRVQYDEQLPVIAAMDLGFNDSTAVWFAQILRGEIRLVDFMEFRSTSFAEIIKQCRERLPVVRWIGPHDLQVHDYSTGMKRIDFAKTHGAKFEVAPNIPVMDGIEAVRLALPRCWFDVEKCRFGIDALRLYRSEWEDKRGVLRLQPLHDWASHPADAFRYLILATEGGKKQRTLFDVEQPDYSAVEGVL